MNLPSVLGKIIEISHSNLEIPSRIGAILNIVSHEAFIDEAIIFTLDPDKRLSCRYANRESRLFSHLTNYRCHVGEGVIGMVAQKRKPQRYSADDVPPRFGCLFYPGLDDIATQYRVFAFTPLCDDSFVYGVLLAASLSLNIFSAAKGTLLSIVSRELGGILRTYDLILTSNQRITELTVLSDLGRILTSTMEPPAILDNIVLVTAKALNARFSTIKLDPSLLKSGRSRFTSGSIDSPTEGRLLNLENEVLVLKKPLFRIDHDVEPSGTFPAITLFSAPIIARGRMLGTITLCRVREHQETPDGREDRYLLTTIASYISSGLENALLNIRLKDSLRELNEAQQRLIEHEKLRSLGEMTANIAHEIKNPLVIIGGFTKRLAKKAHLGQSENKYIEIITKEVARLEAILTEILNYVKESPLLFELSDLNALLDEVLFLLTSDKTWDNVTVTTRYDKTLSSTPCDVQQIKQVFLNILVNAFEAMKGNGTITITTERVAIEDKSFTVVSLQDTGGGIDPSKLDNIFNPFFTTKEQGSGLGLAITNKIVIHHGGQIEVQNKPGEGVIFVVYLPDNYTTREG
jgi:signal transduction histidine kinase